MGKFGAGLAALGALALMSVSTAAYASTTSQSTIAPKLNEFSQSDGAANPSAPSIIPTPHKTYQLDVKGRWGVKVDLEQPTNRDVQWKDVQAGAYFNVNRSIRVGGSVGLGDKFAQPQHLTPEDTAPRVRLETAFKF